MQNRFLEVLAMLTVLGGIWAAASLAAGAAGTPPPVTKAKTPQVTVYLRNGTDVTGSVQQVDATSLHIKTTKGTQKIPMTTYQGLVLNTTEELKVGKAITQNFDTFLNAVQYSHQVRTLLDISVQKALGNNSKCKSTRQPLAHFRVNRQGKISNFMMLSQSDCPAINQIVAHKVQTLKFPPLDKAYPLDSYVLNYFYKPQT